ncbi:ABC transporter permease/M1 family aminopeptidase [Rufibacter latericius]|uniref:Peptidase M1 membrane alanine aminopeptidase domain-containing protein n=1 Tax=Rufibacter latericius TaxID=2487040 RepID=A0A3M9MDD4_9BACT|nr:M1 family aminopeptidase [Rufibacter latericius]RNI23559.1 hypothetical protein EFB08_18690 [Rufibacter latericius]
MKFRGIFRFEFAYQLRHVSTWLLFSVMLLFGFLILRMVTLEDGTYLNAPGTIAFFTIFGSVIWLVIGGVIAGDAATRDVQTRMHPLTYTTPVSKASYLGARFLSALTLNGLILLLLYVGMLFSFYGPGAKSEFIGPFRLASYLTNFCFLALPTVIATTAIQFSLATLSRRAIAGYIASIILVIFSQFAGTTVRFALDWKVVGTLMDLLGTSIATEMEGWTPIDKNNRLILLEGTWLWNRMAWLSLAAVALAYTYFRFRLAHVTTSASCWSFFRRRNEAVQPATELALLGELAPRTKDISHIKVLNTKRVFNFASDVRQALAIAGTSFRVIAKSRGGLTLVAILALATGLFATEYMEFFGVPLFARTEEVLRILTPSLSSFKTQWFIIPLLTIFFAGELVWREREAGMNELSDATPVRGWVMFLGKFLGLALIIVTWLTFLMVAGIINQLVMDYHNFELGVYFKVLFGIQLTNYLLFALLVFAIHVVVNQKYIGHMVAFCAYGYIVYSSMLGVEHNLLVYASDTGWSYSDMRGFGPFMKPWLWFKFYWVAWAFLIAVIATLFWARSKEGGFTARLHLARYRFAQHKVALVIAAVLVLGSGGFIFYNTNVLNTYATTDYRKELRAEYERRYGQYEHTAQPALTRTRLHVEIYPEEGTADIKGTYVLVNRSKVAIDSIHLSTIPHEGVKAVTFDRAASAVVLDTKHGYQIYSLKNKLEPDDSVQMNFRIRIENRGFSNEGVDASVVANGSHIDSNDWMPVIGYQADRRLRTGLDREKYRLVPLPERPSLTDSTARYDARHAQLMDFEAVVGTSKDQMAVAPGALQRTWTNGDRRYFHYVANAPIHNEYAFFSARYAVREAQWKPDSALFGHTLQKTSQKRELAAKPVTIQIFYHPAHNANVERMVKSAKASLEYYSKVFGPYPYSHFRVLERPGAGRGMHAEPMTIDYQEGYSLMKPDGLDIPYHIMAHEMAHQWWGFQLAPASVEGAGLLVESFATYSAMQVVEETLGYAHLLKYLSQMRQEYEVPRSRAAPPLLRSNNAFMNYRKGPFALFALRHYIGKDAVNQAMRQLLEKHASGEPPLPTTQDFYRELKAVTPDSLQYLLHDLFATNTFWELETERVAAKQTTTGWQVTLNVTARKVVVDETGVETNVPMKDWIEVGIFEQGKKPDKLLYLQKHRLRSGQQTITVMVPRKPSRAGIDPNHLLIDLDMEDNTNKVEIQY